LGTEAFRFVEFLERAGQSLWQILPLGPVGPGNSPYDSRSAFAGNPLLISISWLVDRGLIDADEVPVSTPSSGRTDYDVAWARKGPMLRRAFERFCHHGGGELHARFERFQQREAAWLNDFTLFEALHDSLGPGSWVGWDDALVRREPAAMQTARTHLCEEIRYHTFIQFIFDEQWRELRRYANDHGVRIVGDVPIYVSFDSADVWAHQEIFQLDESGQPALIAGVPPDYFSAEGQLWGNPVYRWEVLEAREFGWWVDRFRRALELVDLARVDHFRGFQAGWHVPAGELTAINGWWLEGPGVRIFERLTNVLGTLPIIAEDLGIITDEVTAMREELGLPGMNVLQFAFGGGSDNKYLPHNYDSNAFVYTGTHDNDTTVGWLRKLDDTTRAHLLDYLGKAEGSEAGDLCWSLIRLAYASVARAAIIPAQDLLGLDSDARMNTPGTVEGNWAWRAPAGAFTPELASRLAALAKLYGRED
jgi:4-alpha-glucanotransferase